MKNKKEEKGQKKVCSKAIKLMGDYWILMIINELHNREYRFCELQRAVGMINPVTLTKKLSVLEENKLISRREGIIDDISVSYSLTKLGSEAYKVVKEIEIFSNKYNSVNLI